MQYFKHSEKYRKYWNRHRVPRQQMEHVSIFPSLLHCLLLSWFQRKEMLVIQLTCLTQGTHSGQT